MVFDASELTQYAKDVELAAKNNQKFAKSFLRKEGSKLLRQTKKSSRSVKEKTGNYRKSIKRGKVYDYRGAQAIRVYSNAPHAHLIENGHRIVTHDGRETGFVPGKHVFEQAGKAFEPVFVKDIDQFLEESLKKI